MKNAEKTLDALSECVRCCILDAKRTEGCYTAPVIDHLEYGKNFSKNCKGNACNARIKEFEWNYFDFIRDNEKFKEKDYCTEKFKWRCKIRSVRYMR